MDSITYFSHFVEQLCGKQNHKTCFSQKTSSFIGNFEFAIPALGFLLLFFLIVRPFLRNIFLHNKIEAKPPYFFTDIATGSLLCLTLVLQLISLLEGDNKYSVSSSGSGSTTGKLSSGTSTTTRFDILLFRFLGTPRHAISFLWVYALLQKPNNFTYTESKIAAAFAILGTSAVFCSEFVFPFVVVDDNASFSTISTTMPLVKLAMSKIPHLIQRTLLFLLPFVWSSCHDELRVGTATKSSVNFTRLFLSFASVYFLYDFLVVTACSLVSATNLNLALFFLDQNEIVSYFSGDDGGGASSRFGQLVKTILTDANYYRFTLFFINVFVGIVFFYVAAIFGLAAKRFQRVRRSTLAEQAERQEELLKSTVGGKKNTAAAGNKKSLQQMKDAKLKQDMENIEKKLGLDEEDGNNQNQELLQGSEFLAVDKQGGKVQRID